MKYDAKCALCRINKANEDNKLLLITSRGHRYLNVCDKCFRTQVEPKRKSRAATRPNPEV